MGETNISSSTEHLPLTLTAELRAFARRIDDPQDLEDALLVVAIETVQRAMAKEIEQRFVDVLRSSAFSGDK